MKKLSEDFKIGCAVGNYINSAPCGVTNPVVNSFYGNYFNCDFWRLRARLAEYEEIGLEPDEIKAIIQDGEDLADAYIRYRNRCVELEECRAPKTGEYILCSPMYLDGIKEKADRYDAIMKALRYTSAE